MSEPDQPLLDEGGVRVSRASIVVGEHTYVPSAVTSARLERVRETNGCLATLALLLLFGGGGILLSAGPDLTGFGCLLVGGVLVLILANPHPRMRLYIATAGGERQALEGDPEFVARVHAAVVTLVTGAPPPAPAPSAPSATSAQPERSGSTRAERAKGERGVTKYVLGIGALVALLPLLAWATSAPHEQDDGGDAVALTPNEAPSEPAPAPVREAAPRSAEPAACSYAAKVSRVSMRAWKYVGDAEGDGNEWQCISDQVDHGTPRKPGALPNSITYFARGTEDAVRDIHLTLGVYLPEQQADALRALEDAADAVSWAAYGELLSPSVRGALRLHTSFRGRVGAHDVAVEYDPFGPGALAKGGYKLRVRFAPPIPW